MADFPRMVGDLDAFRKTVFVGGTVLQAFICGKGLEFKPWCIWAEVDAEGKNAMFGLACANQPSLFTGGNVFAIARSDAFDFICHVRDAFGSLNYLDDAIHDIMRGHLRTLTPRDPPLAKPSRVVRATAQPPPRRKREM